MALADWDGFETLLDTGTNVSPFSKNGTITSIYPDSSPVFELGLGSGTPDDFTTPTTSVVWDNTTVGGLRHQNVNGLAVVASISEMGSSTSSKHYLLIDILNASGGLSGNINTLQTTNLPTAALTRSTDGVGVMAAMMMWTAVGATDTTITVLYTNTADVSGRTATLNFAVSAPGANSLTVLGLQAGDLGVKSVQSVQLSAATGGVGNMGVVLYRPIAMLSANAAEHVTAERIPGWNTGWTTDACLCLVAGADSYSISEAPQLLIGLGDV